MLKNQVDNRNMPFFDGFKTTAAIGLLMQQTAALHCPEGPLPSPSFYSEQSSQVGKSCIISPEMEESIGFIEELEKMLQKGYSLLATAETSERDCVIRTLDPTQTDLIELQLRGLEGGLRNVFKNCVGLEKDLLMPFLRTIAQARSASTKLNNLIRQMIQPVDSVRSSIDLDAMKTLAQHGTEIFVSGRFH